MKTLTLDAFTAWAIRYRPLALAVCKTQAFAECERERVNAYILPIFTRYAFHADGDLAMRLGKPRRSLSSPDELYLSDDPRIPAYYAECDAAHGEHGFTGPEGHCPALRAEHLHIEAENILLQEAEILLGVDASSLDGEKRDRLLTLLLGVCLRD